MARIRTIKPEFFVSPDIVALPIFDRLTYVGLWTHVDDYGRCVDEPRLIHAALFPLDPSVTPDHVRAVIDALHEGGQVLRYENRGRRYLQVVAWEDHQKVSHPGKDKLPACDHPESTLTQPSGDSPETLRPEVGSRNREQGTIAPVVNLAKPKPQRTEQVAPGKRAPDPIWDAVTQALGEARTGTEQSNRGRTVKELKAVDATPDEIVARCREYRRRWPDADLTDAALRKHWSELKPKGEPRRRADGLIVTGAV